MMNPFQAPKPSKTAPSVWRVLLSCLLLPAAFAACGPGEEETELVELEEGAPLEPGGAPPEETPLERAPLGPELEFPPPPREDAGPGVEPEEMPVDPAELEEEIDAAEPVPPAPAPLPAAETQAAGKEVFLAQRCDTCHSVSTAGIEAKTASGGDLAGAGQRLDRATVEGVLRGEEMTGGTRHSKRFSGSQEELDALIDWLLAQE